MDGRCVSSYLGLDYVTPVYGLKLTYRYSFSTTALATGGSRSIIIAGNLNTIKKNYGHY